MNTLLIGWGNPIAGDDGLGWRAAEIVGRCVDESDDVDIVVSSHGGLRIAERMLGYDRVIVLDAAVGRRELSLTRNVVRPREMGATDDPIGHDGSLVDAIRALRRLRADALPEEIVLLGAAIAAPREWDDRLSSTAEPAAIELAEAALAELEREREGIAVV
jgi:hydrogenase maturation protease